MSFRNFSPWASLSKFQSLPLEFFSLGLQSSSESSSFNTNNNKNSDCTSQKKTRKCDPLSPKTLHSSADCLNVRQTAVGKSQKHNWYDLLSIYLLSATLTQNNQILFNWSQRIHPPGIHHHHHCMYSWCWRCFCWWWWTFCRFIPDTPVCCCNWIMEYMLDYRLFSCWTELSKRVWLVILHHKINYTLHCTPTCWSNFQYLVLHTFAFTIHLICLLDMIKRGQ